MKFGLNTSWVAGKLVLQIQKLPTALIIKSLAFIADFTVPPNLWLSFEYSTVIGSSAPSNLCFPCKAAMAALASKPEVPKSIV